MPEDGAKHSIQRIIRRQKTDELRGRCYGTVMIGMFMAAIIGATGTYMQSRGLLNVKLICIFGVMITICAAVSALMIRKAKRLKKSM